MVVTLFLKNALVLTATDGFDVNLCTMHASDLSVLPTSTLEALFDGMPDVAFFIKDRAGRYLCVNQSLVDRCGLRNKRDLVGRDVRDVFAPELARSFAAQDASVLTRGTVIQNRLELHRRAGGRIGWCLTTKFPLRDDAGAIIGIVGVSRDLAVAHSAGNLPAGIATALEELARRSADPRLSPPMLARKAGMPAPRFARQVKRIFQLTPGQLIARARIDTATQLLRNSKASVAEIALSSGYCDHSAFTRAFRQATGFTPTEFREVH